jgi:hypothetical protein
VTKSPTGHIRSSSRVPERWAGHVRPPTQTCPGFWHPNDCFWLSRTNRTVQFWKPDYPVFVGLNPPDRTYPFTVFLTSLSLSLKNNSEGDSKTPIGDLLVPPWNLRVLGWNQLPKNQCLRSSNRFFVISRYFSPNPRSLCPMDGFEIPLVHCLHSYHRSIHCNISKFPWLN